MPRIPKKKDEVPEDECLDTLPGGENLADSDSGVDTAGDSGPDGPCDESGNDITDGPLGEGYGGLGKEDAEKDAKAVEDTSSKSGEQSALDTADKANKDVQKDSPEVEHAKDLRALEQCHIGMLERFHSARVLRRLERVTAGMTDEELEDAINKKRK